MARTERPHILWKNGEPKYLFFAYYDEFSSTGFYVDIDNWHIDD